MEEINRVTWDPEERGGEVGHGSLSLDSPSIRSLERREMGTGPEGEEEVNRPFKSYVVCRVRSLRYASVHFLCWLNSWSSDNPSSPCLLPPDVAALEPETLTSSKDRMDFLGLEIYKEILWNEERWHMKIKCKSYILCWYELEARFSTLNPIINAGRSQGFYKIHLDYNDFHCSSNFYNNSVNNFKDFIISWPGGHLATLGE